VTAIAVVVLAAGCGSSGQRLSGTAHTTRAQPSSTSTSSSSTASSTATNAVPKAHPQAVEPTAGQIGTGTASASSTAAQSAPSTPSGHPKLTGPASITRAPAKGAPTTAQIRSALVSLQATKRRYQLEHVDTGGAVVDAADLPPGPWYTSIASFYGAPLFGNGVACGGTLHPWTLGVANKTLPCGTKVLFQYGSRAIEVKVIDRGPYIAGREWDLTAATAVALHFPGLGPVRWRLIR
jgi:rare lipoprotein A (peptidoglycan hydrolase)